MRSTIAPLLLTVFSLAAPLPAQTPADRQRAQTQVLLGWEEMRAERWDRAAKAFQTAIDIDKTFEYAHYSLGRASLAAKKFEDAIAALNRSAALYRADAGRRFANSQEAQRYRRDRITEIDEQIRQLQTGPQTFQSQNMLREFQNQKRDLQERITRGNDMTIANTVPAFVSLSLGSAYFRAGRLEDAEREYRATVAVDPKSGEAHSNLAVVYLETGRYKEALTSLEAAKRAGFRVHPDLEREIKSHLKQ